jgi:hypothetical protein
LQSIDSLKMPGQKRKQGAKAADDEVQQAVAQAAEDVARADDSTGKRKKGAVVLDCGMCKKTPPAQTPQVSGMGPFKFWRLPIPRCL